MRSGGEDPDTGKGPVEVSGAEGTLHSKSVGVSTVFDDKRTNGLVRPLKRYVIKEVKHQKVKNWNGGSAQTEDGRGRTES